MIDTAVLIVMLSEAVALKPPESTTRTVKFEVPEAVGVPEIVPPEFSVSPAGSEPELMLQV